MGEYCAFRIWEYDRWRVIFRVIIHGRPVVSSLVTSCQSISFQCLAQISKESQERVTTARNLVEKILVDNKGPCFSSLFNYFASMRRMYSCASTPSFRTLIHCNKKSNIECWFLHVCFYFFNTFLSFFSDRMVPISAPFLAVIVCKRLLLSRRSKVILYTAWSSSLLFHLRG